MFHERRYAVALEAAQSILRELDDRAGVTMPVRLSIVTYAILDAMRRVEKWRPGSHRCLPPRPTRMERPHPIVCRCAAVRDSNRGEEP
jgi:hypothetical protein